MEKQRKIEEPQASEFVSTKSDQQDLKASEFAAMLSNFLIFSAHTQYGSTDSAVFDFAQLLNSYRVRSKEP